MERILGLYKKIKKHRHLNDSATGKYAFVGIGGHSINNLYPVLNYLNVPLKYIVTKSNATAELVAKRFPQVISTNDLDRVLTDDDVAGIFISANPKSHYELVAQSLSKGKNVFVEKPPCTTLEELNNLIAIQEKMASLCVVGLQKRYSPCSAILKKELQHNGLISYCYRFVTGAYPEGDQTLDMFIHPLDFICYIFGNYTVSSIVKSKNSSSVFLHLKHRQVIGSIEISTNYSWSNAEETLLINTNSGIYTMMNHDSLTCQEKQGTLFSIPLEKVRPGPVVTRQLFHRNNFVPMIHNNQLFTMGYYHELSNFFYLCEKHRGKNLSTLAQLVPTFTLINQIKNVQ
jgi:virulence factor